MQQCFLRFRAPHSDQFFGLTQPHFEPTFSAFEKWRTYYIVFAILNKVNSVLFGLFMLVSHRHLKKNLYESQYYVPQPFNLYLMGEKTNIKSYQLSWASFQIPEQELKTEFGGQQLHLLRSNLLKESHRKSQFGPIRSRAREPAQCADYLKVGFASQYCSQIFISPDYS